MAKSVLFSFFFHTVMRNGIAVNQHIIASNSPGKRVAFYTSGGDNGFLIAVR